MESVNSRRAFQSPILPVVMSDLHIVMMSGLTLTLPIYLQLLQGSRSVRLQASHT